MKAAERVIVIGRQFGSGGRELGKILSLRLGIPYYDKELIAEAASKSGYRPEVFYDMDERKPSFIRSIISLTSGQLSTSFSTSGLSPERLYIRQSDAIRGIVESGPCVIVGRTADYIARDLPQLFSIFLHASPEKRAERIMRRSDIGSMKEAIEFAARQDRLRERYYNYYTGRTWGAADNYNLCIDTSMADMQIVASSIIGFLDAIDSADSI